MKHNNLINQFIELSKELKTISLVKNTFDSKNFNPKQGIELGKKIDKLAKTIILDDLENFISLLDHTDIIVSSATAEILYPLYPKKCIKILENYCDYLTEALDKYKIKTKIEGLKENQLFFINYYKQLFNCSDIKILNREI